MLSSTLPKQGTVDARGMGPWENITDMVSRKQASCSSFQSFYFLTVLFPKNTDFQQSYFSLPYRQSKHEADIIGVTRRNSEQIPHHLKSLVLFFVLYFGPFSSLQIAFQSLEG